MSDLTQLQVSDPNDLTQLSKYNSCYYGIVTLVKDQDSSNLCWAYTTANTSKFRYLKVDQRQHTTRPI